MDFATVTPSTSHASDTSFTLKKHNKQLTLGDLGSTKRLLDDHIPACK